MTILDDFNFITVSFFSPIAHVPHEKTDLFKCRSNVKCTQTCHYNTFIKCSTVHYSNDVLQFASSFLNR